MHKIIFQALFGIGVVFGVGAAVHGWAASVLGTTAAVVIVAAWLVVCVVAICAAAAWAAWVASAAHTDKIYRTALSQAADLNQVAANTMRSLAPGYRADARQHLVDAQTQLVAMRSAVRDTQQRPAALLTADPDYYDPSAEDPAQQNAEQPVAAPSFPRRQRRVDINYL